eukprot:gene8440-11853_t
MAFVWRRARPADGSGRSGKQYFAHCNPGPGSRLAESFMGKLPTKRLLAGGVIGPAASPASSLLAAAAAGGFAGMMIFGGAYHCCFATHYPMGMLAATPAVWLKMKGLLRYVPAPVGLMIAGRASGSNIVLTAFFAASLFALSEASNEQ